MVNFLWLLNSDTDVGFECWLHLEDALKFPERLDVGRLQVSLQVLLASPVFEHGEFGARLGVLFNFSEELVKEAAYVIKCVGYLKYYDCRIMTGNCSIKPFLKLN